MVSFEWDSSYHDYYTPRENPYSSWNVLLSKNTEECLRDNRRQPKYLYEPGLYITDGQAYTLGVNKAYESLTEIYENEVMGQHMKELENKGYFDRSVTLLVLKYKSKITIEQKILRTGKKVVVTGNPVYDSGGNIVLVATTVHPWYETHNHLEKPDIFPDACSALSGVIASSKLMQKVLLRAARAALIDSTVLITGETGVGKEVIAKVIHQLSSRSNKPFINVNAATIPEELFESELFGYRRGAFTGALSTGKTGLVQAANGGTLFLDEIGDVSLNAQVKLLRLLQEKEITPIGSTQAEKVDVRFIAATNRNLKDLINKGLFRDDLYYRLNVVPIHIPPLRQRPEDICSLAQHFLAELCCSYSVSKQFNPHALQTMVEYSWPGNIRELKNMIERLLVLYPQNKITSEHVLEELSLKRSGVEINSIPSLKTNDLKSTVADFEKYCIKKMLLECCGNIEKTAQKLGIHRTTLLRKLRKYKLKL